jgi:hypothetical protein
MRFIGTIGIDSMTLVFWRKSWTNARGRESRKNDKPRETLCGNISQIA